jgi:polyhydroxyalkanoate synthase subunit PhaC
VTQARRSRAATSAPAVAVLPDPQAESLGAAEAVLAVVDPMALGRNLGRALLSAGRRPLPVAGAVGRLARDLGRTAKAASTRAVGRRADPPVPAAAGDRRFADPAWEANAWFFTLQQAYLAGRRLLDDLVAIGDPGGNDGAKARFAADLVGEALAPTNFLASNPAALRKAFDTGGLSVVRGARNATRDVLHNQGWPRQVDRQAFALGTDLAATPGQVVFRNDLIELIQYAPVTEQVHAVPLLVCPPWINKYYITDLAPGRSLVEWAVQHGLTTFAISYRNPDGSMRGLRFEDYLFQGQDAAVEVAREICGSEVVNTLAVCLGATMNAALLAYYAGIGESPVGCTTYLNALVDFQEPGTLGCVFGDARSIDALAVRMERSGCLDAADMAHTFDLLRARDLVFAYVASGWLMGEDPPPFDLLAWNADSTRMPAGVHLEYLRRCYVENALVRDRWELGGVRLQPAEIDVDAYIVSAIDDHIVPWRGAYGTTQVLSGSNRFVLSSAGHIAGIVNPPSPKARLWTNDELPPDPDVWLAGAEQRADTWWNDWAAWIAPRSGPLGPPPPLGGDAHPPLGPAPGTYVFG